MPFAGYKDFEECVRKNSDKSDPKAYCGSIKAATEGLMAPKKKSSTPTLEEFRGVEIIDFDGGFISAQESEDGRLTAKIRIIKAGLSKNNRNYRPSALEKAARDGIFNGTRMFVNHTERGKSPLSRGFMDMVSAIESTEYDKENQALNGNVEFFDKDFYDRVNRAKKFAGVSIDSLLRGTRTPQPGGRALEDIHEFTQPRSVDWVVYPAAGGQILAMEEEEGESVGEIDWAAVEAEAGTLSAEDLKKNSPTLWKLFHPEGTAEKLPVHGNAPESTAAEYVAREDVEEIVIARLTAYEQEQKLIKQKQEAAAEQVRAAFASSGLPPVVRARVMHGFEGISEFSQEAVQKAIDDAKEELKAVGVGPRISGMGPGGTPASGDGVKTFSVKESVEAQFGKKPAASGDASKEGK